MRRFYSFLCLPLLIMAASSCQFDDTELQNSIDDLTSRVEALEDFQEQVQGDIASLQDIISKLNSSVTVNNVVDNGDGSWTINFSDGTSVTIRNGQDGEDGLTPPSITVVEEDGTYYWAYEDADGNIEFILDGDGNKIPVTGEAPQVQINPETGNWEISTDGGKTWEDTNVKAEGGDGDSFFSQVEVRDGILYIVLADGTVIEVPMTAELAFDFGTDEAVLYFSAGESKTFKYVMSGAETYAITKPDGWRASIEGEGLVITAPAAENTFAETEGVVSVILFAENGQSFMAEQAVAVGSSQEEPKPETGDYFYSDGTWSSELDMSKTVLGIVFVPSPERFGEAEKQAGYTNGLVIALKNAAESISWSKNDIDIPELENTYRDAFYNDLSGLHNTNTVWARDDYSETEYRAFAAVASWNSEDSPYKAPENTSGWFLPSSGQMYDMFHCLGNLEGLEEAEVSGHSYSWKGISYSDFADRLNAWMSEIPDGQKDIFMSNGTSEHLWTSSETFDSDAREWSFYSTSNMVACNNTKKTWDVGMNARPMLAF